MYTFQEILGKIVTRLYYLYLKKRRYYVLSTKNSFNIKIDNLNDYEWKYYSQHGEDGIIDAIFKKIGTTNKYYVEFGVGDATECNTRYLTEFSGWDGILMDCIKTDNSKIKNVIVNAENIVDLFKEYNVPKEFDLLSIDIDSNDYWVWKAITGYKPRVVIIEYNACFPPTESKTIFYDPNYRWDISDYFGATLSAMVKLGKEKGYTLVGCDSSGTNAFFVLNELAENNFNIRNFTELYFPPKFGTFHMGKFRGYVKSNRNFYEI